jgi:hypothetical protein
MAVNESAISELTAIGRRQGRLRLDDVKRVLPVESMSADELAEAMTRLEEAGIEVDLDPDLLRPRHDAAPQPTVAAGPSATATPAEPATASPPPRPAAAAGRSGGHVHVYPAEPAAHGRRGSALSADAIVLGVVVAVCIFLIIAFAA